MKTILDEMDTHGDDTVNLAEFKVCANVHEKSEYQFHKSQFSRTRKPNKETLHPTGSSIVWIFQIFHLRVS